MREPGLTLSQRTTKRALDLAVAVPALILTAPIIAVAVAIATVDTREWGIFAQERIGRHGQPFTVYKIRTMRSNPKTATTVTVTSDRRITRSGRLLRRFKLDELPQLINVVLGDMSLVGPRPDVPGLADRLEGKDRILLSVRPGITGPATLAYRDEEELLASVKDPVAYNRGVVWPRKVELNREYVNNFRVATDVRVLLDTVASVVRRRRA